MDGRRFFTLAGAAGATLGGLAGPAALTTEPGAGLGAGYAILADGDDFGLVNEIASAVRSVYGWP